MSEPIIVNIPDLPERIVFTVAGKNVGVTRRLNGKKTHWTYDGSNVIKVPFTKAPADISVDALLLAFPVSVNGAAMKVGEPRTSQPRYYKAGSPNAGKPIPGTGNRRCVTHTTVLDLPDSRQPDTTVKFQAQVTFTYLGQNDGKHEVRLSISVFQQTTRIRPLELDDSEDFELELSL